MTTIVDHPVTGSASEQTEPTIRIKELRRSFRRKGGDVVHAIDGVSLDVQQGEMVVLLGPSGCGKTTLLRCIAGLEVADSGEIVLQGTRVAGAAQRPVPPEVRGIGMMFQSYALWPHMTVDQNVAYPLEARGVAKAEIKDRVANMLAIAGIGSLAKQYPGKLSGGQQQRVALARSLVAEPAIMLFDEPLSNVDAKVRGQLRYEIAAMQDRLGFAAIYVTHDQDEAMQLADRIAVMRDGQIVQMEAPAEVYLRPRTEYVAQFLGALNQDEVVRTTSLADVSTVATASLGDVRLPTDNIDRAAIGAASTLVFRPEHVEIGTGAADGANEWRASILRHSFVGLYSEYLLGLESGHELLVREISSGSRFRRVGEDVVARISPDDVRVVPHDVVDEV